RELWSALPSCLCFQCRAFGARSPLSEFVATSRRLSHQLPFGSRMGKRVHHSVHQTEGDRSTTQLSECCVCANGGVAWVRALAPHASALPGCATSRLGRSAS